MINLQIVIRLLFELLSVIVATQTLHILYKANHILWAYVISLRFSRFVGNASDFGTPPL